MASKVRCLAMTILVFYATSSSAEDSSERMTFTVDLSHQLNSLRWLQDVDNGPLCQRGVVDLTRYYKELNIRNVRLHDVPWTYDNSFDINYVFPNWKASVNDPNSYDFTQTDFYLNTITSLGINVIYRLGYSAEYTTPVHHNQPPLSYQKFATIAAHIIQHHNFGWANGQKLGIKYWEIWNEPDGPTFWAGTPEQFDRLYAETAIALKRIYPSLKVGGPALAANLDFLDQFLKYCQEHKAPVDFISWHIYTQDPSEVPLRAQRVHSMMEKYGFAHSESILDEWNYAPNSWRRLFVDTNATREFFSIMQSGAGAAFDVAVLTKLQDAPVDIATYYTGTTLMFGMFSPAGVPQKPYYAFLAFRRLLDSPNRVPITQSVDESVTAIAGISKDGQTIRILMSNRSRNSRSIKIRVDGLTWKGKSEYQKQVVSDTLDLQAVGASKVFPSSSFTETLNAQSVLLLTIRSSAHRSF